jgi:hypothetical protein
MYKRVIIIKCYLYINVIIVEVKMRCTDQGQE